jgi:hypothetical protein
MEDPRMQVGVFFSARDARTASARDPARGQTTAVGLSSSFPRGRAI